MRRPTVLVALLGLLATRGVHAQPAAPDAGLTPDAGISDAPAPDALTPDAPTAPADAAVPSPDAAATAEPAPASMAIRHSASKDTAWLLVGGALTFVTIGAVLAYAADSSQTDLSDLYVSNNGQPPVFDSKTKARYDELVAQGHRYEHLSWGSFGIAAGMAIGAAIFFVRDRHHAEPTVTPVVTPTSAGVSVRF